MLLVPPKLTKSAYQILLRNCLVPRPWHSAGRHGSRTHRVGDRMGIPLISSVLVIQKAHTSDDLQKLMNTKGVCIVHKTVVPSNKIPKQEALDATVHPERKPKSKPHMAKQFNKPTFTFKFAEMFAGIGGFGVALEALGGECVFCSELSERCRQVYTNNLTVHPINLHGNCYSVTNAQFPSSVDLLVAGFPCQPFSALGSQPGLEDSKGLLFLEIVRFLRVVQPKGFLLENVPGLLQLSNVYEAIVKALEDVGYNVTTEVVSARCLTATARKRLLFVGLRHSCTNQHFLFPYIPDLGLRAGDILENDLEESLLELTEDQMAQLGSKKSKWKPSRLAWNDTVCDTLDSHYGVCVGKGNSQLVPTHSRPRRMSPRECASIMGFPSSFQLPNPQCDQGHRAYLKEQYRMIGNAVCPPLMAAVAGAILEQIHFKDSGWEEYGRRTAIKLALEAVRPNRQSALQEQWTNEFTSFFT